MDITKKKSGLKPRQGSFISGMNVRRDENEHDVWRPAGLPEQISSGAMVPLLVLPLKGTSHDGIGVKWVIWGDGQRLGVAVSRADDDSHDMVRRKPTVVGTVKSAPLLADVVEEGVVRVMLRHAPAVYLTYDAEGRVSFHGEMPLVAGVGFAVTDEVTLSEPLSELKLSGLSNHTTGPLTAEDNRKVGQMVTDAYRRLMERAARMGYLIQPVIARWRMLDGNGDTVAMGPQVMACASSGFQCCNQIAMTSIDSLATLRGGALTARAYRLRLIAGGKAATPWNRIVKWLRVEMTDQIDPADDEAICVTGVSTNGSQTTVNVNLPGVEPGSAGNGRRAQLVTAALAGGAARMKRQGVFAYPLDGMSDVTIGVNRNAEAVTERGTEVRRDAVSFSAACRCGSLTLLANRRSEGFAGHTLRELALSANGPAGMWQGVTKVRIVRKDGSEEIASTTCSGQGNCPTTLSPLLVYPDADAVDMTVTLRTQTGIVTENFKLTPMEGAGLAYYLRGDLQPAAPALKGEIVEVELTTVKGHAADGELRICDSGHYNSPHEERNLHRGEIKAMLEAPRNRSSWDYSREKIMVYGPSGIALLTLDNKHTVRSLTTADTRGVMSGKSVAAVTGSRGMSHLAIAGGDLVEVDRNGITTLLSNCGAETAGRCRRHNEIWMAGKESGLRRLTADGEIVDVKIDETGNSGEWQVMMTESRVLATNGLTLYDAESETWLENGVRWAVTERYEGGADPIVEFNLFVHNAKGCVTLSGDNGSRVAEKLLEVKFEGSLNSPLRIPLKAPQRNFQEVRIEVTGSWDGEWRGWR